MKKIIFIGFLFATVVVFVGCSKESLNQNRESALKLTEKPAIQSQTNTTEKLATQSQIQNAPQPTTSNAGDSNSTELKIEVTQQGTGSRTVKTGDTISVHYTGRLTNGKKFDSSIDRGTPFVFTVGEGLVIEGWEKGFLGAKIGEKRTLTIPPSLGYGNVPAGAGGIIPPNSTLIFDVELVSIQ